MSEAVTQLVTAPVTQAAILAGGASRRFGSDKLRHLLQGRSLLQHALAAASDAGCRCVVVGRLPGPQDQWQGLADEEPGQGPLGGLISALAHCQAPLLLLAGDLPLVQPALLRWLCRQPRRGLGLIPLAGGRWQPTCAIYDPRLLPHLRTARHQGQRSLYRLAQDAGLDTVAVPAPWEPCFLNCNTPADAARAGLALDQGS